MNFYQISRSKDGKPAMKSKFWNFELIAYFTIFLIAIVFRFSNLGLIPLSDVEARLALDSYSLNNVSINVNSPQVFLTNITAIIFYIFGENNFLVRIIPAITGCLLVISPIFFRRFFNKKFLLIISFWMAIDPGFVALSRQINSSLLLIFFGLITVLSILNKKYGFSGIFLGLMLLCGTSFWLAIIPLSLSIMILKFSKNSVLDPIVFEIQDIPWKKILIFFGGTVVLGSTAGFIYPEQFGNILNGFLGYMNGWTGPKFTSFWFLIRILAIYNLPLFFFGFIGLVWLTRNFRDRGYALGTLLFFNLLQLLIYPQRNVEMLIWVMLPLLISASIYLNSHISLYGINKKTIVSVVSFGLVFLGFMTLISLKIGSSSWQQTGNNSWSILLVLFGLVLIVLAILLIGWTISWKTAEKSFLFLLIIYFGVYSISASWSAGGLRASYQNEMWWIDNVPTEEDLVKITIDNFSEWNGGFKNNAQIQVVNLDYPSIRWALRGYKNIEFIDVLPNLENPQMIISRVDEQIAMVDSYRGQDFSWIVRPDWSFLTNSEWETWFLSRSLPIEKQESFRIILWVRNDLFSGAEN